MNITIQDAEAAVEWVSCDKCFNWRKVPTGFTFDRSEGFFCSMIESLTCDTPGADSEDEWEATCQQEQRDEWEATCQQERDEEDEKAERRRVDKEVEDAM